MEALFDVLTWLIAMLVLMCCSAFFSASEAALFYLRGSELRALKQGNSGERAAAHLLADPERLLSAVLFWNLVINVAYFAIVSIVGLRLGERPDLGSSGTVAFSFGALLVMIFCSEMLPKSIGVLRPRRLAALLSIPLAVAVRMVDPLMPTLRLVNLLSRRLIWPTFEPEPYLEVTDLERAIQLSTTDAELVEQEQQVLQNIVMLSDIRVDELMRPRMQFMTFRPPVHLDDLAGQLTPSGYLLVTEPHTDEVVAAVHLTALSDVAPDHLEHYAEPVVYVPWCTTVANTLEQMQSRDREVAAIVNEFGETIGILTFEDILDTIFTHSPDRGDRHPLRRPIVQMSLDRWRLTGMTSLRRLARYFDVQLPPCKSVTVSGIVQEVLERLPSRDDECDWGPFHFRVTDAPERGQLVVEVTVHRERMEEIEA